MFRPITPKVLLNTLPISNLPGRPNVAVVMIISPESPPQPIGEFKSKFAKIEGLRPVRLQLSWRIASVGPEPQVAGGTSG
jgi:hypothetical protein